MANTRIQIVPSNGSGSTTIVFGSPVTVGNLLVVAFRAGLTLNSVTDTLLNTWNIVYNTSDLSGASGGWAYTFTKASGANTVTVNQTGILAAAEYNGPNSLRVASAGFKTIGSTPTSSAVSVLAGDLLLGLYENISGSTSLAAGSGYTLAVAGTFTGSTFAAIEENLNASTNASQTVAWSGSNTNASVVGIGAFFAQTFTITGNAGVAGATVSYSGASSGSVTADGSGNYTITVNANGAYTITPSKAGFSFSPVNQTVNLVSANVTGINFTATGSAPVVVASDGPMIAAIMPVLKARIRIAMAQRNKE